MFFIQYVRDITYSCSGVTPIVLLIFLLLTVTINFFDTITASSTERAAHHTSSRAHVTYALHAIQTARPRFHTTTETPTNILTAFGTTLLTRALLGKLGSNNVPQHHHIIDCCILFLVIPIGFGHWYTFYIHFFLWMLKVNIPKWILSGVIPYILHTIWIYRFQTQLMLTLLLYNSSMVGSPK